MKHRFYFVVIAFASLMLLSGNASQAEISSATHRLNSGKWLMTAEKEGDVQKILNGVLRRHSIGKKKSQHPSWLNNTGSNVSNVVPSQGSWIVVTPSITNTGA
ncbi:hypothetical protein [Pectobacterium actinidiae]|uniref:hypothetical protein n=1 Tax=Pectobacterium actinidiae TaxID=1507808 RepID=UPI00383A37C1